MLRGEPISTFCTEIRGSSFTCVLCLHLPLPLLCNNASNGLRGVFVAFPSLFTWNPKYVLPNSTSDFFLDPQLAEALPSPERRRGDGSGRGRGRGVRCSSACVSTTCCRREDRARKLVLILQKVSILREMSIETVLNIQYRYVSINRFFLTTLLLKHFFPRPPQIQELRPRAHSDGSLISLRAAAVCQLVSGR